VGYRKMIWLELGEGGRGAGGGVRSGVRSGRVGGCG